MHGGTSFGIGNTDGRSGRASKRQSGESRYQGPGCEDQVRAPLAGFLTEINGKYKLRVTGLTLAPGGYVGEHNHFGPGIRGVTSGYMTYVLPEKRSYTDQATSSSNPATSITPSTTRATHRWCTCYRNTARGPWRTIADPRQASLAE